MLDIVMAWWWWRRQTFFFFLLWCASVRVFVYDDYRAMSTYHGAGVVVCRFNLAPNLPQLVVGLTHMQAWDYGTPLRAGQMKDVIMPALKKEMALEGRPAPVILLLGDLNFTDV